jgi:hypothetical protein
MIATTIITSMSVKPRGWRLRDRLDRRVIA